MSVPAQTHEHAGTCRYLWKPSEGVRSPGAGVPGSCESFNVGAETPAWAIFKISKHLLSHLPGPQDTP